MASSNKPNVAFKEFLATFNVDNSAIENAQERSAQFNEKLANVALEAAGKSSEISAKWTAQTIDKLAELTKARVDPAEYGKAVSDYATAQADIAAENMTAFADLAKHIQMETVNLMMAAGKELSDESAAALKEATDKTVKAAKSGGKK